MQIIDEIKGIQSTYTIKTIVKHNEQSNIKLGIDQQTHKEVAIKMYRNIESNELLLLKKFSEYSGFKNVVNIIEVIEGQNSEYFVIMEYANKGDLRKYLEKNNQMNSQQRKQIILQIAQGLGELHQQNLVHRNISPENILVFQSNEQNSQVQYKLTDFCYLQDKNISKTTNIGTPYYMAPELLTDFNNKQNYKQEVDIWALGCIYFEIITGVCLFNGNSQDELFKKIKDAKQSWIDSQIDQLSKYNIIEREQKLLKLIISIDPVKRPHIHQVQLILQSSDEYCNENSGKTEMGKPTQTNQTKIAITQDIQLILIEFINYYISEYDNYSIKVSEIKCLMNDYQITNQRINEQYEIFNKYFQSKLKDVQLMKSQLDQYKIHENIKQIRNYIKQLDDQYQSLKLTICEEQFILSGSQLQTQFEIQKIEFQEDIQQQFIYIDLFLQGRIYQQKVFEPDLLKIKELYFQQLECFSQFHQFEDYTKVNTEIQNIRKQSKQLKQICKDLIQNIHYQEIKYQQDRYHQRLKDLQIEFRYHQQNLKKQLASSPTNQDLQDLSEKIIAEYGDQIQKIVSRPQTVSKCYLEIERLFTFDKIQDIHSQMLAEYQSAYNKIINYLIQENQKNKTLLQQQEEVLELTKSLKYKDYLSLQGDLIKIINEMEKYNISNIQISQKLNEIKSQFQSNFPQMGQQDYITFTTQQIQQKIDFLNQLNQSCVELKAKIEMEAQQIKKQLEYVKQEFQQELQFQVQKIQDLQNKATSIDPSLQKDIETITKKIIYQQQQINEHQGQDTDEQRITNIRNAKQSNMTEYNSIIERLQASSSLSNQANLYFNQVLSNYRSNLDKVIDTVTLRLSQIKQNLTELQQIKSKTIEINSLIQNLTQYQQQYEEQLYKYQQSKQKQFDQTQLEYIQAEYEQAIRAQGQIETESTSSYNLYSQVYQYFWQHLMNVFTASKTQLENEQIKKKEKMNGIIANFLKENKTIKTDQECKKILDENIEQINNDFQQLREQVDVMLKQNPREQKSFSDFDKGLREIDKQVGNIQEYTQKLRESEQKDLESFEEALKYTPNNQMNYIMNQVKLRAKIKDQALIRKILQMKDLKKNNEDIQVQTMKVFYEINEQLLKNLLK